MKVKELENQNSSLVTVINLLNKEQGNDGNKEQWKTVNNRRRSRVECRNNNIHDDVVEVVPLENRYASSTKYSNDRVNQSETFSNESNQQQKQAQRQVQDRSNNKQNSKIQNSNTNSHDDHDKTIDVIGIDKHKYHRLTNRNVEQTSLETRC